MLAESGLEMIAADDLTDAAKKAVAAANLNKRLVIVVFRF